MAKRKLMPAKEAAELYARIDVINAIEQHKLEAKQARELAELQAKEPARLQAERERTEAARQEMIALAERLQVRS